MDTTMVSSTFKAKVWKIGSNLPCLLSKFGEDPITLNGIKILNIGDARPFSFGDNLEENTFTVTGCSEIAKQTNYPLLCKSTFFYYNPVCGSSVTRHSVSGKVFYF